jgi:hypothetical protein
MAGMTLRKKWVMGLLITFPAFAVLAFVNLNHIGSYLYDVNMYLFEPPPPPDSERMECKYKWEKARILARLPEPAVPPNRPTKKIHYTSVYYEQVMDGVRYRWIALYEGTDVKWDTCANKLRNNYGTTQIEDGYYPTAIVEDEGFSNLLFTTDRKRAVPLEKLPIVSWRVCCKD